MNMSSPQADASATRCILAFRMCGEVFGFDISCVREVVEPGSMTRIPQMQPWFLGVMNLRGLAVPAVDLRARLGLGDAEQSLATRLILVDRQTAQGSQLLGVLVDAVLGVREYPENALVPPPRAGGAAPSELLAGVIADDDLYLQLFDDTRLLSVAELCDIGGEVVHARD